MERPTIRGVEAFPVEIDGRTLVCLRDPLGHAERTLLLPYPAFFIVSLFDGAHTILDIQEKFVQRFGELLPSETVRELAAQLDAHYYMEGERFTRREAEVRAAFGAAAVRPLAHAGQCYDPDPEAFRAQVTAFFTDPAGPGLPDGTRHPPALRALIAPHIDLRVGGPCYAWAYRELAERSDADVFVLLGTSHHGGSHPFILTEKDYDTPLGPVRTDRALTTRLRTAYGGELLRDEIYHRTEHSLEFQALFLQFVLGGRRPFTIVPILVGSFHHMVAAGRAPLEDPAIGDFVAALRRVIDEEPRRVCIVAGVDFAHVGRKFGDEEGLDADFLRAVETDDRTLLAALERGDAAGFFGEIAAHRDRRRICGLSPMYTLLSALPGARGRLLRYDRSDDPNTQSAVSYASLAFD
jgi:AmmeMemoRadiSam system protein B